MVHKILGFHKTLGVVFLCLLLLGVWLTYAVFTKKFTDYEEVTLRASSIGLQLPSRADVKIRGVIVGEVLETKADESGAELTLGIYPEHIDTIPENVTGSIVPKTLFGEKYVSLVIPESGPAAQSIEAGDTITRTEMATEVEEVLADLYPLLRTVQPAQLNATLTALATALEGRGEELGENLETVDSYLKRINPQIPALLEDLRLTAEVSDTYADILPEVADILDNTVVTTGTLEEREIALNSLLRDVASFADTARVFLDQNADRLERFGELSAAQLALLSRYSTLFPCLSKGLVNATKFLAEAFRGFELHIILETLPNQPRRYNPNDRPRFAERRGPSCLHLPTPPGSQANPFSHTPNFNDGVDEPTGKGVTRVAPHYGNQAGYRGAPADVEVLRQMLHRSFGDGGDSDLGVLLAGPLVAEGGARR